MFKITHVCENDKSFWSTIDHHFDEKMFELKIRDKQGYLICDGELPIGIMRYNLFWDLFPFLNLIKIEESYQGKGFGKQAMLFWENEMKELGHLMVMISTQVDEPAQHFYRNLGYIEKGSLFFDSTPFPQAQEMLMIKIL